MIFNGLPPLPQLGLWTFEPAFSPRFSFPLSPRSFFQTRQRFPISNHVTSGCMSPRSSLDHWAAVSHTGNDMTSSSGHVIALDQSEASIFSKRAQCTTQVLCSLKRAVAASALRYFSSFVVFLIGDRNIVESCIVLYIFAGKH